MTQTLGPASRIIWVNQLLQERYEQCDTDGHYALHNPDEGVCGHCFRHVSYESQQVKETLESRRGIPTNLQPLDASELQRIAQADIDNQRASDITEGFSKLIYLAEQIK